MTPKIPRDISGKQLAKVLSRYDYEVTRQTGSHLRLTTSVKGEHHITIPAHDPLKVGTLSGILGDGEVARHLAWVPGETKLTMLPVVAAGQGGVADERREQ